MNNRAELKNRAKAILKTSYWKAFFVSLIVAIANGQFRASGSTNWKSSEGFHEPFDGFQGFMSEISALVIIIGILVALTIVIVGSLIKVFLGNPIIVSANKYYIEASDGSVDLKNLGFCFNRKSYLNIVLTMFMMNLFIFLWSLLLIVPGIIKSYSYSMVPYLLAKDPELKYNTAIEESMKLMDGNKGKLFVLDLSFIGWYILGLLALIIGVIFVVPYHATTRIEFFNDIRNGNSPISEDDTYTLNGQETAF